MSTRPPHWFTLPVLLAGALLAGITGLPAHPAGAQALERQLHLPLVHSAPIEPLLLEVDNPDGNGDYTLAWVEQIPGALVSYELQEAADPAFTSLVREVCATSELSCAVTGQPDGTWYYRVRGILPLEGPTRWSNTVSVVAGCAPLPYDESIRWNLLQIEAPPAWGCPQGGQGVTIAILDTGVYTAHPDLAPNLLPGFSFVPGTTWADDHGHGTHVAGIAAGAANNATAGGVIAGVAPSAAILPVKVCDARGSCAWDAVANGIYWAVDNGARVINMSLGGGFTLAGEMQTMQDAVQYAHARGVVMTCSAGNDGNDTLNYPAAFTQTIALAATTSTGARWPGSNYGSWVDASAPGASVYSSYHLAPYYATMTGTSMAAPHAAGLAALILALRPAWQPEQVRAQLTAYADDIGTAGYDIYTGWGRINARRAVAALGLPQPLAAPEAAQPPAQPDINLPTPSRSAAYVPGEILFKPREGRVPADVLPASVRESGFRSELAVARAGVWVLRVPPGEELTWLARLRVSPDVLYAELNGLMRIH